MEKDEGGYLQAIPWPMVSNYGLLIQRQEEELAIWSPLSGRKTSLLFM